MSRVADLIAATPWAMTEIYVRAMLELADRDPGPALEQLRAERRQRLEALQGKAGTPLRGTANVTMRGTTAIVPVSGPLFRYANLFTDMSGATSLEQLASDFTAALESAQVQQIVLAIDSPGGQVNGIAEMADMIAAARDRKPITAYVSDTAASGAYWLASAAGTIAVAKTSTLGSIGVVATMRGGKDPNAIEIVSSQSPNKRPDPATEAGRAQLQTMVDRLAQEFIAAVAANRGVDPATVVSDFGQGGVLIGADAVAAGMADSVTTLERLLAGTAAARPGPSNPVTAAAVVSPQESTTMETPKPPTTPAPITTIDALRAAYPDLVAAIEAQSATSGAAAERARVVGIQAHGKSLPGHDALVQAAIDDGKTTPDQIAGRLVAAEGERGKGTLNGLRQEGQPGPKAAPTVAGPTPPAPAATKGTTESEWGAEYDATATLRAEFPTKADYVALMKAESEGRVKVLGGNRR